MTSTAEPLHVTAKPVSVGIADTYGWARAACGEVSGWFKGYVILDGQSLTGEDAIRALAQTMPMNSVDAAVQFLSDLDGQFAFVLRDAQRAFASVDRVRTVPLFYGEGKQGWRVDDSASRLALRLGLKDYRAEPALEVGMAGYCIGADTITNGLSQIQAGEVVVFESGSPTAHRYYRYRPWRVDTSVDDKVWQDRLTNCLEQLFQKLGDDLNGRPVMLPLSGGLDSRLVASGLRHVGYESVTCYSYGVPGNYEAHVARQVAERLGYRWVFIPYQRQSIRSLHDSEAFKQYAMLSDTRASVPFFQDFHAVGALQARSLIPEGAVFINGNSGCFLSGAHIPPGLTEDSGNRSPIDRAIGAHIDRHFALWGDLVNDKNRQRLFARQRDQFNDLSGEAIAADQAYAAYEFLEWQGRQAKFVTAGQRVYEFFGYHWRLPLWDAGFMDFWEGVPLHLKYRQSLYKQTLADNNWGGVWSNLDESPRMVPAWVIWPRRILKLLIGLAGRKVWHGFERRVFGYWMDVLRAYDYTGVTYSRLLRDGRGFRGPVSFRAEEYLREHGLGRDGAPLSGAAIG